jgi:hypothetical protein
LSVFRALAEAVLTGSENIEKIGQLSAAKFLEKILAEKFAHGNLIQHLRLYIRTTPNVCSAD